MALVWIDLREFRLPREITYTAFGLGLIALGAFTKSAQFPAHIWLPGAYTEPDDDFTAMLSAVVSKAAVFGLVLVAAQLGVRSEIGLDPAYVLGWVGILTATFGALMAVFQEDVKRLLAYSSMGQLGYIVAAIALMNHLGWVTALYLSVNHFLYKGILFLAVAGVIMRTGTRLMYRMGGLIKNLPWTFFAVMIAIIAMSGVPPLTGFGGKWMLFNAMMDKGWYWLAALAFFSSAVAFLYMFRLLQTVFLGQRKLEHKDLSEAPAILLIPQFVLIVVIATPWLAGPHCPKHLVIATGSKDGAYYADKKQISASIEKDSWLLAKTGIYMKFYFDSDDKLAKYTIEEIVTGL